MNILLVFAHPEAQSLNGSLRHFAVKHLQDSGHNVQVSDLYAMNWKAQIDGTDSLSWQPGTRFSPAEDSQHAFANGTQSKDIEQEQAKLLWADMVILQFPLWWFSMPAILKGWIERVYAYGFAYGVGEYSDTQWGERYGQGKLVGKRAMLIVTAGGWESHYSARGISGPMDDLLFPIQHGMLYYPGFSVLPPFVVYQTQQINAAKFEQLCAQLGQRLDTLETTQPIAFRPQNHGDYDIPELTLKADIAPERSGFAAHIQ